MQNAEVRELVQRSLERYADDERVLRRLLAVGLEPDPALGRYALEENAGFIATNLMLRYGEPAVDLVMSVNEECRRLAGRASIQELQRTIVTVLNGPVGEQLRQGIVRRLTQPYVDRRALTAWLVNRARWRRMPGREPVVAGEFDWSWAPTWRAARPTARAP